jgi:hypothetical protein
MLYEIIKTDSILNRCDHIKISKEKEGFCAALWKIGRFRVTKRMLYHLCSQSCFELDTTQKLPMPRTQPSTAPDDPADPQWIISEFDPLPPVREDFRRSEIPRRRGPLGGLSVAVDNQSNTSKAVLKFQEELCQRSYSNIDSCITTTSPLKASSQSTLERSRSSTKRNRKRYLEELIPHNVAMALSA